MERIKGLLHEVAKENSDSELHCFFLEPEKQTAIAGYRRLYGYGDCLVRAFVPDLNMGNLPTIPGCYYYRENMYFTDVPGLPGKEMPNGREFVNVDRASEYFSNVYQNVVSAPEDERFSVLLSPKLITNFIDDRTKDAGTGMQDRKMNIQVFDGVNVVGRSGNGDTLGVQFPAAVRTLDDGTVTMAIRSNLSPDHIEPGFIDDSKTLIPSNRLKEGKLYVVEATGRVEGRAFVRVLREFKRGIRMAMQWLPSGLLMPNQARYSVHEEPGNKITTSNILEHPFIEGQQGNFHKAPMITIDVDTLYRALKPMVMYKVVEMMFKDSITGIILRGIAEPGQIQMDAIAGPTSPYKSGKVYTA